MKRRHDVERRHQRAAAYYAAASAISSLCAAVRLIGSRSSTIVPDPGVERMRIAPWCNSVSDFAIASPKPEP